MSTEYAYHMVIFIAQADVAAANADAAMLDSDSGGAFTFDIPLSGTGALPASHYGTDAYVKAGAHAAILGPLSTKYPAALVYDRDQRGWTDDTLWHAALADAGLAVMRSDHA